MYSDLELMKIQVKTLFTHDAQGRLCLVNEPGPLRPPASRFFLGMTRAGHVTGLRHDLPTAIVEQLVELAATEPPLVDWQDPPRHVAAYRAALQTEAAVEQMWLGPAYQFPDRFNQTNEATPITAANAALLQPGFADLLPDIDVEQPCFAIVKDGQAVSVCRSVRIGLVADEAGVGTLEAYRGRGYASLVVAAWAAAVREQGRLPLYSTSWDNLASQNVARKLGLRLYGVDFHLT